jgi:hypothetical protein
MSIFLRFPSQESWNPKIFKIGILATLDAHNFLCKPLIEVKSNEKL